MLRGAVLHQAREVIPSGTGWSCPWIVAREGDTMASVARRQLLLARGLLGLTITLTSAAFVVALLQRLQSGAPKGGDNLLAATETPYLIAFVAVPIVGYAVASRRPDNAIGWLLAGVGAAFALDLLLTAYSIYAVHGGPGGRCLCRLARVSGDVAPDMCLSFCGPGLCLLLGK